MTAADRFENVRESEGLASTMDIAKRRWALIVGIVIVCVLVGVVRHERSGKSYSATASVAFQSGTLPDAALQVSPPTSGEPLREAATEVLIAHSAEVAQGVRKQLRISTEASELLGQVTVEAAPNADVLHFTATTSDPGYSARLANAFANQYISFKVSAQLATIEVAEHHLQQQIAALPAGSGARVALEQSQQRIVGLRAVAGGEATVIGLASTPTSPAGTTLKTTAVVSLLIGLAAAFSVIFLLESLDRRIKTIEEFERAYGVPALTGISQGAFGTQDARKREATLEPYRILRSALDFVAATRQIDTLLVTSAVPSEGKTTVAIDLAHAIALTGRATVLVELDLRRPTFVSHFGLRSRDGVTSAIAQGVGAMDLLVYPFNELPGLAVLPAGRLPPNPAELLGAPGITEILSALAATGALVVIDAPPLNPVADAQILLGNSAIHAALVVARVDHTTREEVRRARAILDRHAIKPVGLAVTGLKDAARYGYEAYESNGPTALDPQADAVDRSQGGLPPRQAAP